MAKGCESRVGRDGQELATINGQDEEDVAMDEGVTANESGVVREVLEDLHNEYQQNMLSHDEVAALKGEATSKVDEACTTSGFTGEAYLLHILRKGAAIRSTSGRTASAIGETKKRIRRTHGRHGACTS